MAALHLSQAVPTAVISKLYPMRSHTGAAQGGIGAALGNAEEDHWEWHMFDTVKGSDYLGDQDAIEIMCREAPQVIYDLEHIGLPFDRTPDGRLAQRAFGGHTRNFGEGSMPRACYAADRTGHMILHTLYQQCVRYGVRFFDEFHLVDLLIHDGVCCGAVAWDMLTGELHVFHTKAVVLATGGWGRIFQVTTNAHSLTGDGCAIAYRCGLPLQDMEFYQFHPTGIYRMGILITEGARGVGGILRNDLGEAFMERYAPTLRDLAPRDMVSRSIHQEIVEGRGIDGQDYVHLDLTHLGEDVHRLLPEITGFVQTYQGLDPATQPIPVQPSAHYAMGGIPTDVDGRVIADESDRVLPGLYAAGECACVSVHGANRLGTNSLLDILVFGRRAAAHASSHTREIGWTDLPPDPAGPAAALIDHLLHCNGSERPNAIRADLQAAMMRHASVSRTAEGLRAAQATLDTCRQRFSDLLLQDKGRRFNTDLLEAIELGSLLDIADVTLAGALAREESRGAHYRTDFPERDDANWLRHTLAFRSDTGPRLCSRPVRVTRFQPKPRTY
jgi:succinate dehydrogenase / fumarate reductase flavoprotein subunit